MLNRQWLKIDRSGNRQPRKLPHRLVDPAVDRVLLGLDEMRGVEEIEAIYFGGPDFEKRPERDIEVCMDRPYPRLAAPVPVR